MKSRYRNITVLPIAAGVLALIMLSACRGEDFSRSAIEFTRSINAGWNLGNTFESHDSNNSWPAKITPEYAETKWWNPRTTEAMFKRVADSGFNAVRIPVTWDMFTTRNSRGEYRIDPAYLARVKEVVGYAQKNRLIVIVNMHHDDKRWLDIGQTGQEWSQTVDRYRQIWSIIASEFRDYDENLILEAGNEMIAGNDWWGHQQVFFDHLNELYKTFHQVVRQSGGNNAQRYLMLPTYGAQWYPHQYEKLWFPANDNRIICDIHWYSSDLNPQTYIESFDRMARYFRSKNVAFVLGECGLQKSNVQLAEDWSAAFVGHARRNGIPCFLWDDGGNFQILVRQTSQWKSPDYVAAVINAATGKTAPAVVKAAPKGAIVYQNWYCNGGASVIQSDGTAVVTSGPDFVRQVQPCYNFSPESVEQIKKLARTSKDGFVYIDFFGRFETGSDTNKLFFKCGLQDGGAWNIGKDWQYTLVSGGKVTIPFPVKVILDSKTLSLTIQANNYTFGAGIRNLKMTISTPYVK